LCVSQIYSRIRSSYLESIHQNTDIDLIERVQNRFLKFVPLKFNLTIDNHDYTQIRYFLNITALSSRREIADISFIYKLINGITDNPDLLNCIPFLTPPYNNRSTSLFYIPVYNTNYLKNSPILRAMAIYISLIMTILVKNNIKFLMQQSVQCFLLSHLSPT
jgi:hypothetical protein